MFTGLIQDIGTVQSVRDSGTGRRVVIATGLDLSVVPVGASIACSGVCLTVTEKSKNSFSVDVSAETLNKTVIGEWMKDTRINIEPSLQLGDELGGHFVFGHIDGTAVVESVMPDGESLRIRVRVPEALTRFIAPRGSVALDGISLTVNEVEGAVFGVNIIPHTQTHTTLGGVKAGDSLNVEIDMLARYVERMMTYRSAA